MRIVIIFSFILVAFYSVITMAMDIQVKDRNIQDFLPWLATETGKSLILSPDIQVHISLSLKDVEWHELVTLIATQYKLSLSWVDGTAVLMPFPLQQNHVDDLITCDVQYWLLKNAKAKIVSTHLHALFPGLSFTFDDRTNSIMSQVCDRKSDIVATIAWLDVPGKQVEISARIAQVQAASENAVGVEWQALLGDVVTGDIGLGLADPTSELFVSLVNNDDLLALNIDLLEAKGLANIISEPKIVTEEGKTALIESGTEVPYRVTSGEDTYVEFKQAGLTLEVTPYIQVDERVQLELKIYQDAVGEMYNGVPSIDTNRITTQVVVADQETLVLGGIYRDEVWTTESRVPFFSNLPFVGALFKQTTERQEKVELLVFITPKLLQLPDE